MAAVHGCLDREDEVETPFVFEDVPGRRGGMATWFGATLDELGRLREQTVFPEPSAVTVSEPAIAARRQPSADGSRPRRMATEQRADE